MYLTCKSWNRDRNNNYFKVAVSITFAFIGLRACVVGADTYNYTMGYLEKRNIYNGDDIEPLYIFYTVLLRKIMKNELFFILCNTFLSLAILYALVKRYSLNKTLSVLLFFLFGIYQPYFVALRQILAIAILLCGVYYVAEDRKWKWIVYTIFAIAALYMHNSTLIDSILFVIVYFIPLTSRKIVIWIIVMTSIVGVIFQAINLNDIFNLYLNIGMSSERLNKYVQDDQINNLNNIQGYIWLLRYAWLGLFVFHYMDEKKLNNWFTKIYLTSIIMLNIFYNVGNIIRMNLVFNIFSIIVFTWVFGDRYHQSLKTKRNVNIIIFIIIFYFAQDYIRGNIGWDPTNAGRMHPYYFFFEDYSNHPSITRFS